MLGPTGRRVLMHLAAGLRDGQMRYGDFPPGRDLRVETLQEHRDAAIYLTAELLREEAMMPKGKCKPPKRAKPVRKGKSRSAKSGKYVSRKFADTHKATTVTERD